MNSDAERRLKEKKDYEEYVNTPGKLPMWKFRNNFRFNINRGLSGYNIDDLSDSSSFVLDFDVWLTSRQMNLQRPLVWTERQKEELIFSILKGITIPPITIIQDTLDYRSKQRVLRIIDGKQRLTTLIAFVKGEFGITYNETKYFFDDLSYEAKREINGCLRCDIGYSYPDAKITDDQMIAWFEQINFMGTQQDKEHMNKLKLK